MNFTMESVGVPTELLTAMFSYWLRLWLPALVEWYLSEEDAGNYYDFNEDDSEFGIEYTSHIWII